jgi:hypothetical protein
MTAGEARKLTRSGAAPELGSAANAAVVPLWQLAANALKLPYNEYHPFTPVDITSC